MKQAKFIVMAALGLIAFAGLMWLGFWQVDRLHWKQGLEARIAAEQSVDASTVSLADKIDAPVNALSRGYLVGLWMRGANVQVGPRLVDGQIGYWILTPLQLNDGTLIWVNRGWIGEKMAEVIRVSDPQPGIVTVAGTLRESEPAPEGAVGGQAYSWRNMDTRRMGEAMQLKRAPVPTVLFAETTNPADDNQLQPARVMAELRNNHLQYAIFWFACAGVFLALSIYAAWSARRRT